MVKKTFVILIIILGVLLVFVRRDNSTSKTHKDKTTNTTKDTPAVSQEKIPLLEMRSRGGLCPNGECDSTTLITADGRVFQNNSLQKTISPEKMQKLVTLILDSDFEAIKSRKFTGTCPIAYDGQETTYNFYTPDGVESISSCQVEIDYTSPLFAEVANITQ